MSLRKLYKRCRETDTNVVAVVLRYAYLRLIIKKNILAHPRTIIRGVKNIQIQGLLEAGIGYAKFMHRRDTTYLNIQGKLIVNGNFSLGRGCRLDVDNGALLELGANSYLNPNSKIIAMHHVRIGKDCAISWDCLIVDDDFHQLSYPGKINKPNHVLIGDHVWIGSSVTIFAGSEIADNCVIAGNSVVRGVFGEQNVLIAGNPARVIRQNVNWSK